MQLSDGETYPGHQQDPVIPPKAVSSRDLYPYTQREEERSASIQKPQTQVQRYLRVHVSMWVKIIVVPWRKHVYMLFQGTKHSKHQSQEWQKRKVANERRKSAAQTVISETQKRGEGKKHPKQFAIRGSVAFQIQRIAINQQ